MRNKIPTDGRIWNLDKGEIAFQDWLRWKNKQERECKKLMKEQKRTIETLKEQEERLKQEVTRLNREIWLKKKTKEKKREDATKQKLEEMLELKRKERKIRCQESVTKWMEEAKHKPKPTRNSMGLASLVCTNIGYINPVAWQNIVENGESCSAKTGNKKNKSKNSAIV